jgi:hypothetical protein
MVDSGRGALSLLVFDPLSTPVATWVLEPPVLVVLAALTLLGALTAGEANKGNKLCK